MATPKMARNADRLLRGKRLLSLPEVLVHREYNTISGASQIGPADFFRSFFEAGRILDQLIKLVGPHEGVLLGGSRY